MLDEKRKLTLKKRLGAAVDLIDDDRYLPMFRNRQIHHPELFAFSIEFAKRKDNPARYFAALWGAKTLAKTLDWLQKLINAAKSKAAEAVRNAKKWATDRLALREADQPLNRENRRKLEQMKRKILNSPPPGLTNP